LVANPDPQPWIASLYLAAAWGAPWLLGRIYFCGNDGARQLIGWMVAGMAVIVPIALVEGAFGPKFYQWFYGLHPFRFDGVQRYVGFRPLGFFEDGNQYGIWVAATALAAVWLWKTSVDPRWRGRFLAAAILGLAIALLSQSLGAIVLLCAGLALSLTINRSLMRWAFTVFLLLMASGGAVYLSGKVPMRALAEKTVVGRHIVETMRSSGRGSFIWRIGRDQTALPLIGAHPVIGTARWDWWRKNNERPWGLAFLILGQFGLTGLVFAFGAILTPALRALATTRPSGALGMDPATPLAVIVLMASADALLNSFLFYPVILFAGALMPSKKAAEAHNS
jgi:GNAT superfamily N-acetyltransferase